MPAKLKVFALYAAFWILFAIAFAVMFAMLFACAMGIPSGIMLAVLGGVTLFFKTDFVITALAPQVMLFGGLAGAFLAAFSGLTAVKIGTGISRFFVKIRRKCDKLRGWELF